MSWALTWIIKRIAIKKSIIDTPNERSSHSVPTPRGGGLAIVITWFIGLLYLNHFEIINNSLFLALLSGIILVIIGFIDDIYNISPLVRFCAQVLAAGLALYFLGGVLKLDLGFIQINSGWLLTPIAFIGIIWFINLYNFLDGIDGYAAMEAIFVSLGLFLIYNESLLLVLIAATLGFIIWNWQPAKIFMGDVGSTLLGFNVIIITLYYQNTTSVSLFSLLLLSSLFWVDATLTLLRRYKNKEKLTEAHKKHAYQRIVQSGFSHQKTVIYGIMINLILFILFYFSLYSHYVTLFFVSGIIILYIIVKKIDKLKSF